MNAPQIVRSEYDSMEKSRLNTFTILGAIFVGVGFILLRFAFGENGSGYIIAFIVVGFALLAISEWLKRKNKE